MQDCGQCVALTHRNAFCLTVGLQGALAIHEGGVVKSDGWGLPLPLLTGDSDGSVSATPLGLRGRHSGQHLRVAPRPAKGRQDNASPIASTEHRVYVPELVPGTSASLLCLTLIPAHSCARQCHLP